MKNRYKVRMGSGSLDVIVVCPRLLYLLYVDGKFVLCANQSKSVTVGQQTSLLLYPK